MRDDTLKEAAKRTLYVLQRQYGWMVASSIALLISLVGVSLESYQDTLERAYYFLPKMTPARFDAIYHQDLSNTLKFGALLMFSALALFIILMWLQRHHTPVHKRLGWAVIIIIFGGLAFAQTMSNVYMNHAKGIEYYHPERKYNEGWGQKGYNKYIDKNPNHHKVGEHND